jgi:hypothetical protein
MAEATSITSIPAFTETSIQTIAKRMVIHFKKLQDKHKKLQMMVDQLEINKHRYDMINMDTLLTTIAEYKRQIHDGIKGNTVVIESKVQDESKVMRIRYELARNIKTMDDVLRFREEYPRTLADINHQIEKVNFEIQELSRENPWLIAYVKAIEDVTHYSTRIIDKILEVADRGLKSGDNELVQTIETINRLSEVSCHGYSKLDVSDPFKFIPTIQSVNKLLELRWLLRNHLDVWNLFCKTFEGIMFVGSDFASYFKKGKDVIRQAIEICYIIDCGEYADSIELFAEQLELW